MAEILITQNDRRRQVTAVGAEPSVTFDFPIFEDDQISVLRTIFATGLTVTLVLDVDYTVTGIGVQAGGTVIFDTTVFPTGLAVGDIITMSGDAPIRRITDFQTVGDYFAADINRELDVITLVQQELNTRLERAIHLLEEDTTTLESDLELPLKDDRALQFLSFDANGKLTVSQTVTGVTATAFSQTLLTAADRAAWLEILLGNTPINMTTDVEAEWAIRHRFTRATGFPPIALTDAPTVTWDGDTQQNATLGPLTQNFTLANIANARAGHSYEVVITQDPVTPRTITYGANYVTAGGALPALTASINAIDRLMVYAHSATVLEVVATLNIS